MKDTSVSRRQWLGNLTGAGIGAGLAVTAQALGAAKPADQSDGARIYNIRDFGAKGDGATNDTKAIQAAIDACFKDGGGTVLIPAGVFLSGTLQLRSFITLHLAAGGKLLGSPKREDYTAGTGVPSGNGNIVFLYAVGAEKLSIEGKGTIDGNGLAFYNGKGDNTGPGQHGIGGNFDRPHLLIFFQCSDLRMNDVFLNASAYHCVRILQCRQVWFDGVRIYNRVNKNNDGFHFSSCQYVHIVNCDVQCQDDACALFGSNRFVTVTNCTFSTRWSIFRFGGGATQHVTVSNCLIYDTYGCPIKINAGNASIEHLTFSNIVMQNVTGPIGIGFSGGKTEEGKPRPFMRHISFSNIQATVVAQPMPHPDIHFDLNWKQGEKNSCITLNAMGEHYLEDISLSDIQVHYAGGGTAAQAAKTVPEVAAEYFGVWDQEPGGPPAYGLYARNVKGLNLHNIRFTYAQPDERPAVIFDNVQDAAVTSLSAQGHPQAPLLRLVGSKDVLLTAIRALTPAAVFLRVEGAASDGIIAEGGDYRKAKTRLATGNGVPKTAVILR